MVKLVLALGRRWLCLAALLCTMLPHTALVAGEAGESIAGTLADGTNWQMTKPANWNGTILLDLDGGGSRTNPFKDWLLAQGFATGGTQREPVGYDFPKAVDNLLLVRQQFITKWGEPRRTLAVGGSRGAFVARIAMERRPDIFAGALISAGAGAGSIANQWDKLNSVFALKTLVDPGAPLKLVDITDADAESAALTEVVKKSNATPQGRARLALAAAFQQYARWSSRGQPKPAPQDYEAQVDQIAESYVFGTPASVRAGVEKAAGGNVSWNQGVDYADLLERSGRKAMVEALYRKAGLDLTADLAVLARAPRIKADPAAVAKAEKLMSYTGDIRGPVVNVDNDDTADSASHKLAYIATLERAGKAQLFQLFWADSVGHAGMSALDRAVGFRVLVRRLDSGQWGDVSLPALRVMGARIARENPALGELTLFDPGPIAAPLFTWDRSNWGSYKAR